MDELRNDIKERCREGEPAFCGAVCPFRLDVPSFIRKIRRGAWSAAYRAYRDAVVFPDTVSRLCSAPCREACCSVCGGAPIDLPMLEHAVVAAAPDRRPNRYNVPPKPQRIAVIGAGPGGLCCALRLSASRYDVTVFEKSDRVGGHLLRKDGSAVYEEEFKREFSRVECRFELGREITSLDGLDFDAVYVATGAGGSGFGQYTGGGPGHRERPGMFFGGALCGSDTAQAIADGLEAVVLIEKYLKTGFMSQPGPFAGTRLKPENIGGTCPPAGPKPAAESPTMEEAAAEAGRCLLCSCDVCRRGCDFMEHYRELPRRIAEQTYFTVHKSSILGSDTTAIRMMSTCSQCGACADRCPEDLDTGRMLLEARRALHREGRLPWAFHDFWLRDMEHATAKARLMAAPREKCSRLFFPGCQIGASDPRYVLESYRWLLRQQSDTALLLDCCGVPAVWAGDTELAASQHASLRGAWEALGRPEVIFACPTCQKTFGETLPEIRGRSLYTLMAEAGFAPKRNLGGETWSVFDPCATRGDTDLHAAVRDLCRSAGTTLQELSKQSAQLRCCGTGGHTLFANPTYTKEVADRRVSEGGAPYIAYCANCRDVFADDGKACLHFLDLAFDLGTSDRPAPGCTERRRNREELKWSAQKEFCGIAEEIPLPGSALLIDDALKKKLSDHYILEDEAAAAVLACERSGRSVTDTKDGSRSGYAVLGRRTVWVKYRSEDRAFRLLNAYAHRMRIESEKTWNGKPVTD